MLRQLCDDTSDSVLIEKNSVTWKGLQLHCFQWKQKKSSQMKSKKNLKILIDEPNYRLDNKWQKCSL